jgi:periplasmic protein TonB
MGYQALLFCPDEKTARTVTQVLSELEFNVESCTETFAAVKRLMGDHFDAIVVDCDNEQNATLLFKSARNSTSNQASLAVAVVEGQAGVAKAFRIGANLVLTKPINVDQAKGTLRVARGLLRKGETAKSAASPAPFTSAPVATPSKTAPPAPERSSIPSATVPPSAAPPAAQYTPIPDRPAQAATAMASSLPSVQPQDSPAIDSAAASTDFKPSPLSRTPIAAPSNPPATPAFKPAALGGNSLAGGAASAPAPARIPSVSKVDTVSSPDTASIADARAELSALEPFPAESSSISTPAPSFTFGGANAPAESKGGSKKVLVGIIAAAVVAAALYFGWSRIQGHPSQVLNSSQPAATPAPVVTPPPVTNRPAPASTSSAAAPAIESSASVTPASNNSVQPSESAPAPQHKTSVADSESTPSTDANSGDKKSASQPHSAPLVLHHSRPTVHARAVAGVGAVADAPSMVGIAAPGSGGSLNNLVASNTNTPAPVLQTLNVSQGVSQGLLVKKVQPSYPPNALRLHVEGAVQLLATISKSGNISAVKVLSGDSLLAKPAAEAVKQWKYKPYLLNGDPVEIQTQITINFKLPR